MIENNLVDDLISLSHEIGHNPALVQGGGGNTSVKLDEKRMLIKSSGVCLKDMHQSHGLSMVDYSAISNYLKSPDSCREMFIKRLLSFTLDDVQGRPSMETGFHALLKIFVLHTHSVYANLLTCSFEGLSIAKNLFSHFIWIDYKTPGRELTLEIKKKLDFMDTIPSILFLKNHGLIVTGDTKKSVLSLNNEVNSKIIDWFNLEKINYSPDEKGISLEFIKEHILFPDQVVYAQASEEILWSYRYLLSTMRNKNLRPNFLSKDEITILLNMESERYRQKMAQK